MEEFNYGYSVGNRVKSQSGPYYTDDATGIVKSITKYGVEVTLETAQDEKDVGRTILYTPGELYLLIGSRFERLTEEFPKIYLSLISFVEYFSEIEKGNYSKTRPEIRTYEQLILDRGREALSEFKDKK